MLVIDGLVNAAETAQTDRELKRFIHGLQIHASLVAARLSIDQRRPGRRPARAHHGRRCPSSPRAVRAARRARARVQKFRGSAHLRGHTPFISARAASRSTRIEALYGNPSPEDPGSENGCRRTSRARRDSRRRPAAGVDDLVTGPSGSGKTTLACSPFGVDRRRARAVLRVLRTAAPHRDEGANAGAAGRRPDGARGRHHALAPPTERTLDSLGNFSRCGAGPRGEAPVGERCGTR